MSAPKTIYALHRKDFSSYSGFYYTWKDAKDAGEDLKVRQAWPTSEYEIVVFEAA